MSTSSSRRCIQFSIQEIETATNQFKSKILGRGGEATVYLAEIFIDSKKTPVAVKRLKESSNEFEREIHTVSKIQHPYLVSLLGYCNESGHKILVYEYMAKGCLSDYVTMGSPISLSWLQRLTICHGAARGLQHLHKETDEYPFGIIHRDVKPGNILVGENWIGKVSDFGMFKLSSVGQDKSVMSTNVKGTFGYYAPEYVKYNHVTRKIDVYAFGVVLFQVLCRKMPWDRGDESYYGKDDDDLGLWAQQNVDTQIKREISGDSLRVFTGIIGISLQPDPDRRPTMDHVVLHLEKALECQYSKIQAERPTATVFLPRFSEYSIEVIKAGTNQFDSSKIISHGAEAIVYLADIQIGQNMTQVAVKQLKEKCNEFEREVLALSKIQHPNLVSLLGYCYESGQQILVYEYMRYGSLFDYLKGRGGISLSLQRRLNMCLGAARGLQYLHTETEQFPNGIIHGDVKPGNILVDGNWAGKLSEIGIQGNSISQRTRIVDVYDFGMLLFEVLSMNSRVDKESAKKHFTSEDTYLATWAIGGCIDPEIKAEMSRDSFDKVTTLIAKSLKANGQPTMDSVVLDLQKAIECLHP